MYFSSSTSWKGEKNETRQQKCTWKNNIVSLQELQRFKKEEKYHYEEKTIINLIHCPSDINSSVVKKKGDAINGWSTAVCKLLELLKELLMAFEYLYFPTFQIINQPH